MEIWKKIKDFSGYSVSNLGRIKSHKKSYLMGKNKTTTKKVPEKIMSIGIRSHGYKTVTLCINQVRAYKRVHRLVAEAFIPNPKNKTEVNHINGIKHDNRLKNLEWATSLENTTHAIKTGLRKKRK